MFTVFSAAIFCSSYNYTKSETVQLVRKALALRAKYRISEEKVRVAPMYIGFHPASRNGAFPSAERCITLLENILGGGFDPGEADCNGVLIQSKTLDMAIHDFNMKTCDGNQSLTPSVDGIFMSYGSLSHGHLNQVFKNILGNISFKTTRITDVHGKLSVAMLNSHDPVFAKYCRDGMLWDVLSYKLQEEEPDGPHIIQAAGNATHAAAMMPHETEAIASLSRLCGSSTAVTVRMSFESARQIATHHSTHR
jgi:hypothetical protein